MMKPKMRIDTQVRFNFQNYSLTLVCSKRLTNSSWAIDSPSSWCWCVIEASSSASYKVRRASATVQNDETSTYLLGFLFVLVKFGTKSRMIVAVGLLCKSRHTSNSSDAESSFAPSLFGIERFLDVRQEIGRLSIKSDKVRFLIGQPLWSSYS